MPAAKQWEVGAMSNHWLRLWHDMPTDPKWRTIARVSKQPISLVIAVYVHLMVSASRNVTRGHADVTTEDIASALDVTDEEISAVLEAMQGRVLNGENLSGWETRQPKREDVGDDKTGAKSAAERKREQRAREKTNTDVTTSHDENLIVTQCHEASRNVTTEERRGDTEKNISTPSGVDNRKRGTRLSADAAFPDEWVEFCKTERPDLKPADVFAKFRDYWASKPGKAGTKLDWMATWRNWVREERQPRSNANVTRNGAAMASYGTIFTPTREEQGNGRTIDATPRLG